MFVSLNIKSNYRSGKSSCSLLVVSLQYYNMLCYTNCGASVYQMAGHKINDFYNYCGMEKVRCSLDTTNVRLAVCLLYVALLHKLWDHLTPLRICSTTPCFVV